MSPLEKCPSCGAAHSPEESFCWMCHRRFWTETGAEPEKRAAPAPGPAPAPAPAPPQAPAAPPAAQSATFLERWTQPALIVAMLFVLGGLVAGRDKGSAFLAFGVLVALFVTAVSGTNASKKKPENAWEWVLKIARLLASAIAIMVLMAFAASVALLMACLVILKMLGYH
ncbi:MAG: hypothetical protein HY079_00815 [Elusimicrobia bacterium]|nr:hypothetical protein [Elusimicrobiota bacterium]